MSIRVFIDSLTEEQRKDIIVNVGFQHPKNDMKWIYPYYIDPTDTMIHLPYHYAQQKGFSSPLRNTFPALECSFHGELRDYQRGVKRDVIDQLKSKGTCVLSLHVGWGKTVLAIYLACKLKLKTLVVVNKLVLVKQWIESIEQLCGDVRVQFVKPKSTFDTEADFYVINAQNVPKMGDDFFTPIGTLIMDEVHLLCAATLYKAMFYVYPRYTFGLSATPHRPDGLDRLIDIYFGTHKITKALWKEHTVYPIRTGIKPKFDLNWEGRIDWNSLLNSQAENEERNEMIVSLVKSLEDRTFLILCKRISQGEYLVQRLEEEKEYVTHLLGVKKEYDPDARILVATTQKCGVGFSHNKLNTLLIASDMEEYFIQYLGRVFRTPETIPVIFDIIDQHPILEKHFKTRKRVYEQAGGTIKRALNPKSITALGLQL